MDVPSAEALPRGGLVVRRAQGSGLTGRVPLQEAQKSYPDLLQLPQELEPPSQAAG